MVNIMETGKIHEYARLERMDEEKFLPVGTLFFSLVSGRIETITF